MQHIYEELFRDAVRVSTCQPPSARGHIVRSEKHLNVHAQKPRFSQCERTSGATVTRNPIDRHLPLQNAGSEQPPTGCSTNMNPHFTHSKLLWTPTRPHLTGVDALRRLINRKHGLNLGVTIHYVCKLTLLTP